MIYVIVFLIATYFYLVVKILKRKKKYLKKSLFILAITRMLYLTGSSTNTCSIALTLLLMVVF